MKAASFGTKRIRPYVSILGALVLGAACLAVLLFFLSGSAVSASVPGAVPPSTPSRIRPPHGYITNSASIQFAWSSVGVPTYTLRLDGQVYTLTATSYLATLADGVHSWAVQAVNDLGEESGYDSNWTLTVDTVPPPRPTLLAPPDGTRTASSAIDFNWTGVPGATVYNLSVDGGSGGVYSTSGTSMQLVLAEGGHTWAVRAVDAAGNTFGYTDAWTVIVDMTPPPIPPLVSPEDNATVSDQWVTFNWGNVGASGGYDLRVEGINPPQAPYTVTVPGAQTFYTRSLIDGTYDWRVRSRDDVGNVSAYSAPRALTVDTVPPAVPTLVAPPNGSLTRDPNVTFDWNDVAESGVTYDLWVDSNPPYGPLSASQHQLSLLHGPHSWQVRAVDAAGNPSAYSELRQVTVDTVSPTLTIAEPAPGAVLTTTHQPTVTIRGTAGDVGTGLDRVQVNLGSGWQTAQGTTNWSYEWTLPTTDEQARNIWVRALDRVGNSIEQRRGVTVDTVAPTAYDLAHDQGIYVNGPVVYSWNVLPDAAGILNYQIRIENTQSFRLLQSTTQRTYAFNGATEEGEEYRAWVRARDNRGNWGSWSASSPVVIPDLTPPVISYPEIRVDSQFLHAHGTTLYYTNVMSVSQLVEITGISVDDVSRPVRVEFSQAFGEWPLDDTVFLNGRWSSAQPPFYGYHVDPGETRSGQIVATVHDAAGNTTSQSFTYEPDSTPPASTADAPQYATDMPIFVDYTAFDTQSGVGPVQLYYRHAQSGGWQPAPAPGGSRYGESERFWFLPPHGDGLYEFVARAEDVLGNRESGAFVAQTSTIYDTTQPYSSVTWAPEYETGGTITGTWEAVPSQAPVTSVTVWVRLEISETEPGTWTPFQTFSITGPTRTVTGTFQHDALADGTYYFATVAYDAADKSEPPPHGDGDQHTIRDSQIGAPLNVTLVQSQEWSTDNNFAVVWTNPEDLSGIDAAIYQLYPESGAPLDPVHEYVSDPPEIDGIHLPAEGRYTLWLWLVDEAGNVGVPAPAIPQTVLKYDRTIEKPISLTVQPRKWSATNDFDVSWTNPDDISGITGAYYKLGAPPFWAEDGIWVHGADLDRIEQIAVPSEGAHTLYLWLKDVAGNVDHRKWLSTTLRYDVSPPEDVYVIAPSLAPSVRFGVEWGGSDYHSGIISYTVAVSTWPTLEWQPWLVSTTQTSEYYVARRANDWVDFRVTAFDSAGNSAQAEKRTRVDFEAVYLPLNLGRFRWLPWYKLDTYEPNDVEAEAYGPLESLTVHDAAIWDETDPTDFYFFVPSATDQARVTLDNMAAGVDLDLAVWVWSEAEQKFRLVGWEPKYGNQREVIWLNVVAGRKYWIEVIPDQIRRSNDPDWKPNLYTLQVVYR